MEKELENDNSEIVEEESTPEQEPETNPEAEETEAEESELEAKNRQLFERAKKAEDKAKELEAQLLEQESVDDPYDRDETDEDLKGQVKELSGKLTAIEEKTILDGLQQKYPILKDKFVEFDEYRLANPGMSMEVSAKAYLAENDLLGKTPPRKGLEKAKGGVRTPPKASMSVEDAKRLRETNYAEYRKQLIAGKIQI